MGKTFDTVEDERTLDASQTFKFEPGDFQTQLLIIFWASVVETWHIFGSGTGRGWDSPKDSHQNPLQIEYNEVLSLVQEGNMNVWAIFHVSKYFP